MAHLEWMAMLPNVVTSRNPVIARLKVFPYGENEQQVNTRILLKIIIEQGIYSNTYEETQEFVLYPDNLGSVSMDIHTILDNVLSFNTPDILETNFQIAHQQSARYRIIARLIDDYQQLQTSEYQPGTLFVIKGGVAREEGNPHNYLKVDNYNIQALLDFQTDQNEIHFEDLRWINLFCNANPLSPYQYTVKSVYEYRTASNPTNLQSKSIHANDQYVQYGQIFRVPYGLRQMDLPIDTTYLKVKITLTQTDSGSETVAYEGVFKNINTHHNYEPKYLFYHNSLGAFSTLRLTGRQQISSEYTKNSITKINDNLFVSRRVLEAENKMFNALEREQFEVETGYINKAELMHLRDLLRSEIAWTLLHYERLIPVNIKPEKYAIYKNSDDLYSLAIHYENAFTEQNYSPHKTIPEYCPEVEYTRTSQTTAKTIDLFWKLPDGYFLAELKWNKLGNPANTEMSQMLNGNEGTTKLFCDFGYSGAPTFPSQANIHIRIRVVCKIGNPQSYGQWRSIYTDVYEAQPIYAINGFADTYKGANQRILTWQNGSQGLQTLIHWANPAGFSQDFKIIRMTSSLQSLTLIGSQGGLFKILVLTGYLGVYQLQYTPPSANFEGVDIAAYSAQQKIGNIISKTTSAKLYVRVKGLQDTGNSYVGVPYLKLVLDNNSVHYGSGGNNLYINGVIHVFSDPLGNNPFSLGNNTLTVTINSVSQPSGVIAESKIVTLSGGSNFTVNEILYGFGVGIAVPIPVPPEIAPSPDFYVIS